MDSAKIDNWIRFDRQISERFGETLYPVIANKDNLDFNSIKLQIKNLDKFSEILFNLRKVKKKDQKAIDTAEERLLGYINIFLTLIKKIPDNCKKLVGTIDLNQARDLKNELNEELSEYKSYYELILNDMYA